MNDEILLINLNNVEPVELQGNGICGNGIVINNIETDFDSFLCELNI